MTVSSTRLLLVSVSSDVEISGGFRSSSLVLAFNSDLYFSCKIRAVVPMATRSFLDLMRSFVSPLPFLSLYCI